MSDGVRTPDAPGPPRPPAGVRLAALDELEVTVEKLIAGGDGFARFEGIPIFVPRSAPGDRLRVRLTERRPDYGRAEIVEVLEPGPGRREPPCPFFTRCGGCDLQHLDDARQQRLKAAAVLETLARLGGVELPAAPELVTGEPWGYRLRTSLHTRVVGEGVEVGYFERGSHELVAVDRCPILVPELEGTLPELPGLLAAGQRPPKRLDLAAGGAAGGPVGGPLSEPAGRQSTYPAPDQPSSGSHGPVAVDAHRPAGPGASGPAAGALTAAPLVEGLPHGEVTLTVEDAAGGPLAFTYDARCFFQAHRGLVGKLIDRVVGPWEGGAAYDLYAGVGLFSLPLARRYRRVVAVEGDRLAARYARNNARRNRLGHVEVETRALDSWIGRLPHDAERVVVDPPRGGLSRRVRNTLFRARPRRLTYVSCHPAALARDLKGLSTAYRLESLSLLDLFPQSGHMEAVAQLVAREKP